MLNSECIQHDKMLLVCTRLHIVIVYRMRVQDICFPVLFMMVRTWLGKSTDPEKLLIRRWKLYHFSAAPMRKHSLVPRQPGRYVPSLEELLAAPGGMYVCSVAEVAIAQGSSLCICFSTSVASDSRWWCALLRISRVSLSLSVIVGNAFIS